MAGVGDEHGDVSSTAHRAADDADQAVQRDPGGAQPAVSPWLSC